METMGLSSLSAAGDIFINRCVVGDSTGYHSHSFIEIAYTAEGEGTHVVGGNRFTTQKGDITYINRNTPHCFIRGGSPLLIYNCVFSSAYLDRLFAGLPGEDGRGGSSLRDYYGEARDSITVRCSATSNTELLNIYNRMLGEYEGKQICFRELLRGCLLELLALLFRADTARAETEPIYPILEYISRNFAADLAVPRLAEMGNFSTSSFYRRFRAATGSAPTAYIQRLRIEESCNLLINTDKSVMEVAGEVGYSDMKHFYAVFKRVTGMLPRELRGRSAL